MYPATGPLIQPGMSLALALNPGSNSLKFDLVETSPGQRAAAEGKPLTTAILDGIGKETRLIVGSTTDPGNAQPVDAPDMPAAVRAALRWLRSQPDLAARLNHLDLVGVRVVHGGDRYDAPARVTPEVRADIERFEELAPLHNRSSLEILDALATDLPGVPTFAVFDTAFHRTLPECAWRYPIERATADRNGIRKFGFHGLSHRFQMESFARTVGRPPEELSLVTLHLESGCSACAIRNGRSVDTTMGLTPLEGLMMGSRSGSVDPAILPLLMDREGQTADEVLTLLNKHSGMLGIAGDTLDTRVLVQRDDPAARLALEMFSYRVRLAVGAYLAALGQVDAVLFGGGIGEDSPWLRESVCQGLAGWGLTLDPEANQSTSGMVRVSTPESRLAAWAVPVDEGLEIAHECAGALHPA